MGLLDGLTEACRIKEERGISFDEALEIWSEQQRQKIEEYEAIAESNVIPFKAKH
jgi:hypothetical protein